LKRVGILYHPLIEDAHTVAKEIGDLLASRGVAVWLCSAWEGEKARAQMNGADLIITTGGDGTILRAAQAVVPHQIPITGVNLGKLGFMTEINAEEVKDRLPSIIEGEGWIDERSMIEVELLDSSAGHQETQDFCALNDVVVARGDVARMIYIEANINGEHLTTYRADGIIVATATGSTAYSLAAGGPILHPQSNDFLMLPITPHLSPSYALVLPYNTAVKLHIRTTHQATMAIDGHINIPLLNGSEITIKHSSVTTRFLRIHPESVYGFLERRLKGKQ